MSDFGQRIIEWRKLRDLTQQSLAETLGVSQATVSRIESGDNIPSDVRQLSKLAKALSVPLSEVLEVLPGDINQHSADEPQFFAFCSNPMCRSNLLLREDSGDFISWKSGDYYQSEQFDEINFCDVCGDELTKDCPSCKRRLTKLAKFCVKCGEPIYDRPTRDEWTKITEILEKRHPKTNMPPSDDIPF